MSDVLEEAEALLVQLPDAVSRRKLGERLGQAVAALRTADHQIARMKALLETIDLTGYGKVGAQSEVVDDMVECALSVGEALADAEDAEALRKAVYEYTETLNKAISTLERAMREHWRTAAADKFQPLIGLGGLLSAMNVANNLGPRLIACGQRGVTGSDAGSAPERLAIIRQLIADYDALQAERAAEIGDDEVGDFINALADKRATLAMVTPRVHAWLTDHGALGTLGVTTRS